MQYFLSAFVPAIEEGILLVVVLGVLAAILYRLPFEKYKKSFLTALAWGFWGSIFFVAVKIGARYAVSREVFECLTIFVSFFASAILLFILLRTQDLTTKFNNKLKLSAAVLTMMLFWHRGMELLMMPTAMISAVGDDIFVESFLLRMFGFIMGVFFAFVSGYIIYRAATALYDKRLIFVFAIQLGAIIIEQIIFVIQVLMARNYLPSDVLMSFMAPIINHQSYLIFIIYMAAFFVPIALFSQKKPEKPLDMNPAEYRKIINNVVHKRRWGTGVILTLIFLVTVSSVGSYYANKKEEVTPAKPISATDGIVKIPLKDVDDGHLHRYAYQASNGVMVRFIIVRKGGSSYGIGLDACEICGPTGYIERDDQVVCKLCDVVMNKATIGTRGGCNPIPIEYKVTGGNIEIPEKVLEKSKKIFH